MSITSDRIREQGFFHPLADDAADEIEEMEKRIAELERQREKLLGALEFMLEVVEPPPERNCRCHISPPCNDCVDYGGLRDAFKQARAAIAEMRGEK